MFFCYRPSTAPGYQRYLCILPQILTGFKQSFKVLFWVSSSFQVILLGFYISAACILLKGEKKKISMMTTSILNIFQFSKGEIWMFNIMLYLRPILYMNFLHIQRRKLRQKLGNKNLRRLFGHGNWTPARQFHVFFFHSTVIERYFNCSNLVTSCQSIYKKVTDKQEN